MKLILKILFFPFYATYKIISWTGTSNYSPVSPAQNTADSFNAAAGKDVLFYDAQGNLTSTNNGYFYDYKGYYHKVGDAFYDSKGNLCESTNGSLFYDGRGYLVKWGDPFYDGKGNYIDPRG